jgi:hypothetical protein
MGRQEGRDDIMYLHPTEYPAPVREARRNYLETADELPEGADWATLDNAQRRIAVAMWVANGTGPWAAVAAFYAHHPDLADAIDDALLPA